MTLQTNIKSLATDRISSHDTGKGAALAKSGEGKRGGHRGAGLLLLLRGVVMSAARAVAEEFPKGGLAVGGPK